MKSALTGLLFWVLAGAFVGFFFGSGIIGFFNREPRDIEHRSYWQPISKEEHQSRMRRYPIYGAVAGGVVGMLFLARARSRVTTKGEEE